MPMPATSGAEDVQVPDNAPGGEPASLLRADRSSGAMRVAIWAVLIVSVLSLGALLFL